MSRPRDPDWEHLTGPAPERLTRAIARHGRALGVQMVLAEESLLDSLQARLARREISFDLARRIFAAESAGP